MLELPVRSQIKVGMKVLVELKQDQGTGNLTKGIVKEILTSAESHTYGIMVELEDGQIGRVKELLTKINDVITTRTYERSGPRDEDYVTGMEITINEEAPIDKTFDMNTSIPKNEDEFNEFKSTFQYDLEEEKLRKSGNVEGANDRKNNFKLIRDKIQKEISLTIAAFANHNGGRLFVGVNDDATVLGLSSDLKQCGDSMDKLLLSIRNSLKKYLNNNSFIIKLKFQIANSGNKQYLVIHVPASTEAIFVHTSSGQEAYVRMQNTSEKFSLADFLKYSKERFN